MKLFITVFIASPLTQHDQIKIIAHLSGGNNRGHGRMTPKVLMLYDSFW